MRISNLHTWQEQLWKQNEAWVITNGQFLKGSIVTWLKVDYHFWKMLQFKGQNNLVRTFKWGIVAQISSENNMKYLLETFAELVFLGANAQLLGTKSGT